MLRSRRIRRRPSEDAGCLLLNHVYLLASAKTGIRGNLTADSCRSAPTDLQGKAGRAWLAVVGLPIMGRVQVNPLLDERIRRLLERVGRLVKGDAVAGRLGT